MTDCELLELAAKAADIDCVWDCDSLIYKPRFETHWVKWNPLTDDGDALRLAVKLNIVIHKGFCYTPTGKLMDERKRTTPLIATRRAIVRAAAEIGKGMK